MYKWEIITNVCFINTRREYVETVHTRAVFVGVCGHLQVLR